MVKRSSLLSVFVTFGVAAMIGACSGSNGGSSPDAGQPDATSNPPSACAPGQQVACACPGGGTGAQVCAGDGRGFGACTGCGGVTDGQAPSSPDAAAVDAGDAAVDTGDAALDADADANDGAIVDAADAAPDGQGNADGGAPACSTLAATLTPVSAWAMPDLDTDDYVCYAANVPVDAGVNHVLGITPNVANGKIVSEMMLFEADSAGASITATPAKCSPGSALAWRMISYWAPGGGPLWTPPDVGFPYDATTKWVVQIHYSNTSHLVGETDTSGFSLCTTSAPVKYDSDIVAFGTTNFSIPAHATADVTALYTVPAAFAGTHPFAAFPHLRELGTVIETEQQMPGGGIVGLGIESPWDFGSEGWSPVGATLSAGDSVLTRCAWQNPTSSSVSYGQTSADEECFSFTAYYPKVASSPSWASPALASTVGAGGVLTPDGGWPVSDAGVADANRGD